MVKEIKLQNSDLVTIVDDDDFEKYGNKKWRLNIWGYVTRLEPREGRLPHRGPRREKHVFLHRWVNKTPDGYFTDHINKNRLDNRKENLRTVSCSENALNRKLEKINKSGYRCVHKVTNPKNPDWFRWRARATINKKMYSLGCYATPEEAHEAYIKFMKDQGVFMYEEV